MAGLAQETGNKQLRVKRKVQRRPLRRGKTVPLNDDQRGVKDEPRACVALEYPVSLFFFSSFLEKNPLSFKGGPRDDGGDKEGEGKVRWVALGWRDLRNSGISCCPRVQQADDIIPGGP